MAKKTTRFYCKSCGHEELRWMGQCPGCREWNTFAEVKVAAKTSHKGARGFSTGGRRSETVGLGGKVRPVPLAKVTSAETNRLPVEPAEVARVLGGGLVEGSVVLLAGRTSGLFPRKRGRIPHPSRGSTGKPDGDPRSGGRR